MSSAKHFTEVLIGGKVYTLSGFEGEEYLQKVSSYLNHKITECTNSEGYRKQSADTRNVLLALNIADDYFKAKKQGDSLESDIELKDKEMYDLKHELISAQIKLENAEKELAKIIQEEKLKEPETRKYLANAFRDGEIKTVGTDIDKLMPPVSRFGGGGRAQKKQGVIDKLKSFFDKFFGIGGSSMAEDDSK